MKKHYILTILLLVVQSISLYAQQKQITGLLKSTTGDVIVYANVLLTNEQGLVVKFSNSDENGKYVLSLPDSVSTGSLFIEVNHLSYKKVKQPITEGKNVYDFLLEKKITELPEVQVKRRPVIEAKGDTLSFNVASFSRQEDRTIGDVLRHMPGVEVAENGQISYNGKAISNLYIHGDDLMDGRYGLAPRTISKEMIKSVEVIQNHQPIKVLKDKVLTDNVAMNFVLKDENSLKLSGQAMLGGGLPEQFDAALNTMVFNKKFKMLNVLKANNSGIDYNDDFTRFSTTSFLNDIGNSRPASLLFAGTADKPDLPRRNYYLNRSGVVNANNLVNTKGGLQLRSNIQVFFDRNTLDYSSRVDNYLSGDTIHYNEWQQSVSKPFLVNTSLTAMANKTSYYLNNNLRFNIAGDDKNSYLDFNGNTFGQRLHERTYDLSNDFNWTPALKNKDIMEVKWYVNYYNNPQHLYIGLGLNSDVLNEGQPYSAINQHAKTPTLFSNATVSYRVSSHLIRQYYELGVINERQQLNSQLLLTQPDEHVTAYAGDAGNDLRWQRNRAYLNSSFEIKKNNWDASLSVPLRWQSIRYYQDAYTLNSRQNQFFVNPSARIKLFLNAEDYLVANYSYNNNVGNISGVYRGAILTNYRSLFANDADLQEQQVAGVGLTYKFQRSVNMLFINAGVNYNRVKANSILSAVLTDNVQRTLLLPYGNDQSTFSATAGISKYLFALKTTAALKAAFTRGHYNQLINNELLPFNNDAFTLTSTIDSKLFGVVSFNYNGTGIWHASRQRAKEDADNNLNNKVKRFDQNIAVGYSPRRDLFFNLKGRHIYSTQANVADINYLFLDANIRYKLIKWRMDLELDVTNLANVKNYEVFYLTSNLFAVNSFGIRGRMAIARATFNL
jgi:hypothetical protein